MVCGSDIEGIEYESEEMASLRQQLADVTAQRDRLRDELVMSEARRELVTAAYERAVKIVEVGPHAAAKREAKELSDSARTLQELQGIVERLRAELLQQPPTLEWLRETFGEPSCVYEKQAVWDELFIWDRRGSRVYHNASQDALTTRATVLEAVAARKIESEGKQ